MMPQNQPLSPMVPPKKSKAWLWVIFVIIIVLIIVGGGYYYLSKKSGKSGGSILSMLTGKWTKEPNVILKDVTSSDTHVISDSLVRTYYQQGGKIVYAESTDGAKTYSKLASTGIDEDTDKMMSNPAAVEITNNQWIIVYEQQPRQNPDANKGPTPPGPDSQRDLYLATSADGKTFQKADRVIDSSKEDKYFASVPDLVKLSDGKIRMYYVSGGEAIASADSSDGGKTWVRNAGYALENSAVDPDVVYNDGKWTMYYSVLDPSKNGIYVTTDSSDGLSWKEGKEIISRSNSTGSVVDPDVFEFGGQTIMLFGEFAASDSTTGQEQPNLYRAVKG